MKDIMNVAKKILAFSKEEVLEEIDVIRDRYTDDNITEYKKFDLLMQAMMLSQALMKYAHEEIVDELNRYHENMQNIYESEIRDIERFVKKYGKIPDDKDRPAPNRFHSDGDGGYYDDFGTGLGGQPEEDMNTNAWGQVSIKGDDMKYWQNKYGLRTWVNNTAKLQALRSYSWCNRVIIMDENRRVLEDITFTEFIRDIYGNNNWVAEDGKEF